MPVEFVWVLPCGHEKDDPTGRTINVFDLAHGKVVCWPCAILGREEQHDGDDRT